MKHVIILLATVCLVVGCAKDRRFVRRIEPGFYAGGSIGYASPDFEGEDSPGVDITEGYSLNLRAGYRFMPEFALEAEYTNYQDIDFEVDSGGTTTSTELDLMNYGLRAIGIIPLKRKHDLFGSLGGGIADWEDESEAYAQAGIGYSYEVDEHIVIRPEVLYLMAFGDLEDNDFLEGRIGIDIKF